MLPLRSVEEAMPLALAEPEADSLGVPGREREREVIHTEIIVLVEDT